ncbi:hypothetical protein AC579_2878 [Pseudocercospora musae]|uniref:Uncharacterized protein n=1 Tax=Pseudocercospora musae TaxID=113226 RepID=A0A139IU52_9PEZI|nr:hypothetical protein AC579_2878 [Pseudocercospora musae]
MITKKQESTTKDQHVAHTATILRSAPDGNLKHFHQRPDSGAWQTEAYPGSRNRSNQCEEWTEEWQHIR